MRLTLHLRFLRLILLLLQVQGVGHHLLSLECLLSFLSLWLLSQEHFTTGSARTAPLLLWCMTGRPRLAMTRPTWSPAQTPTSPSTPTRQRAGTCTSTILLT